MRLFAVLIALVAATAAFPAELPEPGQLALVLDENDFEDYLDAYLESEQAKAANVTDTTRSGCTIRVNGDLGQPQPVYIHRNNYLEANGNSGQIRLNTGEQVLIACTGSGRVILHPQVTASTAVATATCVNNNLVSGAGWMNGNGAFGQLTCSAHSNHEAQGTSSRCFNNNLVIRVGFIVNNVFYPLYWSCFDQNRLEVLYVWFPQNPPNAVFQSGVDRPSWLAGSFFPGVAVNNAYTQVSQKAMIATFVGNALADRYVTSSQFLARGHLAAKTDFVFATGQRATFYFINAAPQWQPFNAGNWNWLEQNLRTRIGQAGYHTTIYTGTFRVTQLRDANNRLVDIFLHRAANGALQIPVPLYFYKVVYDASRRIGTAFISINNPYYTESEVRSLQFCTDSFVLMLTVYSLDLPDPGNFALLLPEDDFENYLDAWLEVEESSLASRAKDNTRSKTGCTIRVNGDLGQPQPVYLHNGNYLMPTGNTGLIHLNTGEQVYIACTGSSRIMQHPNITMYRATGTATCVADALISGDDWLSGHSEFGQITCSSHSYHEAQSTSERCFNDNLVIRAGFTVDGVFYPLYWSCFDQKRLEVLYVWYEQNPTNAVHQSNVDRPSWLAGSFFPGVSVNTMYTQATQKQTIGSLVGSELADKYVTNSQYLARGHLAAKSDFIFATGQRLTFYFINCAPQWQPFNAGNWNYLEQNLRKRIGEAGYNTIVYTGTYGVTQLKNQNDRLVDIYLYYDSNKNPQIPVPLYFYKVIYDESRRIGTAFISINNPYYTEAEVQSLQFCTDRCRNNAAFNWIGWQPDRIDIGYSFCCTIDDFRRTIPHLPDFTVNGLLS
ncbi:hypothetical protein K1T71_005107 [Dendrolimus kikuchii]|uniref:Uncharacterized protein n=1 Tax=Dendrolimus kikuchii TaxID=765133 RepID=A0ACC1D6F8_9NEOP|nr:hypothetical protein K1T71_005107 [Dendrolimus kikuchii]